MKCLLILLFPYLILAQTTFEKAQNLFDKGNYEQSQKQYEEFLKSNPDNLVAIEKLGDIACKSKSWDVAISYFKELKELKPKEANYHYKYGGALGMKALEVNKFAALGMLGKIKKSFENAVFLNPKHIEARWALIELYLKLPGIIGGSESRAIHYSNELMRLSAVDGNLSKGHIEEYFKRYSNAEQYYKKAILIGGSKTTYKKLADLYKNKMGTPEKAKLVLEEYKNKNLEN